MRLTTWLLCLLSLVLGAQQVSAQRNIIHEERSQYRDIVVTEFNGQRCMLFNVVRGDMNQTCMDLSDPDRLIFTYTKMSFAGLLFNPAPERILIAGLGGGTIPMLLRDLYPEAEIDVVEIDPAVVKVAKEWFHYEEDANHEVHVVDARVFIKRAGLQGEKYDFVMLDAFSGEYIPEHLLSREFLQEVKALLTDDGILVANTFSGSRLYDHESVTYSDVFGTFYNFKLPESGNRIILATPGESLPHPGDLRAPARALYERLEPYGINILEFPPRLSVEPDWDTDARILTDQYSPANLLN